MQLMRECTKLKKKRKIRKENKMNEVNEVATIPSGIYKIDKSNLKISKLIELEINELLVVFKPIEFFDSILLGDEAFAKDSWIADGLISFFEMSDDVEFIDFGIGDLYNQLDTLYQKIDNITDISYSDIIEFAKIFKQIEEDENVEIFFADEIYMRYSIKNGCFTKFATDPECILDDLGEVVLRIGAKEFQSYGLLSEEIRNIGKEPEEISEGVNDGR